MVGRTGTICQVPCASAWSCGPGAFQRPAEAHPPSAILSRLRRRRQRRRLREQGGRSPPAEFSSGATHAAPPHPMAGIPEGRAMEPITLILWADYL